MKCHRQSTIPLEVLWVGFKSRVRENLGWVFFPTCAVLQQPAAGEDRVDVG